MRSRTPWLALTFVAGGMTAAAAGCTTAAAAAGLPTPLLTQAQIAPAAHPYDESADAHRAVDAAFAKAKASGKDVLIDLGGNWCPDCRILAGVLDSREVAPWADSHFVQVRVDVGRENKNLDIARRFGVRISAVPTILVVAPDGKLKNPEAAAALGNARAMSPQQMVDLLAIWDAR